MRFGMRHVRYFTAVAEQLHFRRAAQGLNIAQPALTRAIQHLESEIGVLLLDRSNRQVSLTPAGEAFLQGCRQSLAALEGAIGHARRIDQGEAGQLAIGYTDMAINGRLPQILQAFRQAYPSIAVEPVHGVTAVQLRSLMTGELDFGFMTGPIEHKDMECLRVQRERFVTVLYEAHPLAKQTAVRLADLAGEDFITGTPTDWQHYNTHFLRICATAGFTPRVVQHAFNTQGIFGLVSCGMGITIQSEGVSNYQRKGLVMRPLTDCDARLPTVAAWNRHTVTPLKEKFIALLDGCRV